MHPRGGLASASRTSASGGCKKSGREEKLVVRRSAIDERRPERGEGGLRGSRIAHGKGQRGEEKRMAVEMAKEGGSKDPGLPA